MKSPVIFILLGFIAAFSIIAIFTDNEIPLDEPDQSVDVDFGKLIQIYSQTCSGTTLNITLNFNVASGSVDFYAYPAYLTNRCDVVGSFYTSLSLLNVTSFNSKLTSLIGTGLVCYAFENKYSQSTETITYSITTSC